MLNFREALWRWKTRDYGSPYMTVVPLLQTTGITMLFGRVTAVDQIDFAVGERELRCLIGRNGAGESTFFKIVSGHLRPTSGRVLFRGHGITIAATVGLRYAAREHDLSAWFPPLCPGILEANKLFYITDVGEIFLAVQRIT